jgi:2-oxo-hept-3-ene-1,7-dioate hydratase
MTIDDGYAIQRAWVALELADGRSIKGRKIGLTSRAMQLSSQIDEPDYAPLMDDMFFAQGATSRSTASSRRASRWSWPSSWASR